MGFTYDTAIIGGGPGGYTAALQLSKGGQKVVLIEKEKLGGVCLNRGCIPTKALLHCASYVKAAKEGLGCGVLTAFNGIDFGKVTQYKKNAVLQLKQGLDRLFKHSRVDVVKGKATLFDHNTVSIEGVKITADNIIIATGSHPFIPNIEGVNGKRVVGSDYLLSMTELPLKLIIVGAGVIGVELAYAFSHLGCEVTLVSSYPNILRRMDKEISRLCAKYLERAGIKIYYGAKAARFESSETEVSVTIEQEDKAFAVQGDICALTVGRRPNIEDIGLGNTRIIFDKSGINTDYYMKTNIPNIYAVGDVCGMGNLAHLAAMQGIVTAENILGKNKKINYDSVPNFVGIYPEIASVGLTYDEAKEKGFDAVLGKSSLKGNGKAAASGDEKGFCKLICDRVTGQIYGCQLVCPNASDMIGGVCAVMNSEGTVYELADTVFPHPSYSELICEAARKLV